LNEKRIATAGDPNIARDFIYVDDVLDAYLLAVNRKDQAVDAVYNIGSGTQTSLKHVVDVARRVLNIKTEPVWGTMKQRRWIPMSGSRTAERSGSSWVGSPAMISKAGLFGRWNGFGKTWTSIDHNMRFRI